MRSRFASSLRVRSMTGLWRRHGGVERCLKGAAGPHQRYVGGERRHAYGDQEHEDAHAEVRRDVQAAIDGSATEDRGQRQDWQDTGRCPLQSRCGSERSDRLARGEAGPDEHRRLEGSAGSRARHDVAECVPAQLRRDDREPRAGPQRDPLEFPETDVARSLGRHREDCEGPLEMLERSPLPEDREQARQEDIDRECTERQEHDRARPAPPGDRPARRPAGLCGCVRLQPLHRPRRVRRMPARTAFRRGVAHASLFVPEAASLRRVGPRALALPGSAAGLAGSVSRHGNGRPRREQAVRPPDRDDHGSQHDARGALPVGRLPGHRLAEQA